MDPNYREQVQLLISVIPEIAKEECFALHGGTAINLFMDNMPRLSVDIDLTYIPIEDRATSLENIKASLDNIKQHIIRYVPSSKVQHNIKSSRLIVTNASAIIKIEANQVVRGTIKPPELKILCEKAQVDFDAFCEISIVHHGQLYGGKICAALDRQHPRDLFDIKKLLSTTGITKDIKTGFLLSLLSTNRPAYEILRPNFLNQRETLEKHFTGMTNRKLPLKTDISKLENFC
ncbi:nucleotidyl transferase AbiEii/AbiGii toxin family protein [Flexistipes sinusarabici]|uniref:nucleotidyl transferase AbiEii/AbiGii toxin family protein n=1 Tax=Flexistipes sinusarabici TaxID=2352 RepID=UPI002352EC68|nr:nucleotidyl transferase AbiEii/AbiGii toxin family protein [Flexistipes sinusarabici]